MRLQPIDRRAMDVDYHHHFHLLHACRSCQSALAVLHGRHICYCCMGNGYYRRGDKHLGIDYLYRIVGLDVIAIAFVCDLFK